MNDKMNNSIHEFKLAALVSGSCFIVNPVSLTHYHSYSSLGHLNNVNLNVIINTCPT